jgi:hypothetical protein
VKGGVYEGMEKVEREAARHVFTKTKLPWVVILEPAKNMKRRSDNNTLIPIRLILFWERMTTPNP